jgi:hypothetical protein
VVDWLRVPSILRGFSKDANGRECLGGEDVLTVDGRRWTRMLGRLKSLCFLVPFVATKNALPEGEGGMCHGALGCVINDGFTLEY